MHYRSNNESFVLIPSSSGQGFKGQHHARIELAIAVLIPSSSGQGFKGIELQEVK